MKFLYRSQQFFLGLGDYLSFTVAFWFSLIIRHLTLPTWPLIEQHLTLFSITFLFWIIINYINGLYDIGTLDTSRSSYRRLIESSGAALVISVIFFYLYPDQGIAPKTLLVLNVFLGYGILAIWRFFFIRAIGGARLLTRILFIGLTADAEKLIALMKENPTLGYQPVAIIDPAAQKIENNSLQSYYDMKELQEIIRNHKIDLAVIAPHLRDDREMLREIYILLFSPVQITNLVSFYEEMTGRIPPSTFSEGWFLDHLKAKKPVYDRLRGLIDYVIAIVIGIIFILVFPLIALLIRLTSPGPIFIRQQRVGKDGKIFTLFKFRSMYALSADGSAETTGAQFASKNDRRVTPLGKILRKTRLDELPQAWNLFRLDITLIGPRPERPEFVRELEAQMPYYTLRHTVRPGLTGWAVIHQNYTNTLEQALKKLQYDLFYIKNRSFLLDLSILLKTVNVLVRGKGQ